MVGRLVSFWDDLFSGAMLVLGRVGFSSGVHEVRLFEFEQIIMKSGRFHPNTKYPPNPTCNWKTRADMCWRRRNLQASNRWQWNIIQKTHPAFASFSQLQVALATQKPTHSLGCQVVPPPTIPVAKGCSGCHFFQPYLGVGCPPLLKLPVLQWQMKV